jgi:hypothetical protein
MSYSRDPIAAPITGSAPAPDVPRDTASLPPADTGPMPPVNEPLLPLAPPPAPPGLATTTQSWPAAPIFAGPYAAGTPGSANTPPAAGGSG